MPIPLYKVLGNEKGLEMKQFGYPEDFAPEKNSLSLGDLRQRQGLPLEAKVTLTKVKIYRFYEYFNGNVYISFSGGKDSTVLLDIARAIYPKIKVVFFNTGLEYPEIKQFVKTINNVIWLKPRMTFKQVIDKYGYPVISKEVSQKITEVRTTKSAKLRHKRLWGDTNKYRSGKIPEKWKFLINAPFLISHKCCFYLKKDLAQRFEKKMGLHPIVGEMAGDSHSRKQKYLKSGCNRINHKRPYSMPMGFWLEKDIWEYIHNYKLRYSKIYDMGYERTGCVFCMFGVHKEKHPNRFELLKETHPKLYDYCMNKIGCQKVLNFIRKGGERK